MLTNTFHPKLALVGSMIGCLAWNALLAQPPVHRDRDDYDDRHTYDRNDRNDRYDRDRYDGAVNAVPYKPTAPYVRPSAQPSPRHVWVPNEWVWRYGRYVPVHGYWVAPPRKNMRYLPGHWNRTRNGWVWRSGYWTKSNGRNWW